jgi:hypothetical protein
VLQARALQALGLLVVASRNAGHCCPMEVHNAVHRPGRCARELDKAKLGTGNPCLTGRSNRWGWRYEEHTPVAGNRGWQWLECFGATSRLGFHAQARYRPKASEKEWLNLSRNADSGHCPLLARPENWRREPLSGRRFETR